MRSGIKTIIVLAITLLSVNGLKAQPGIGEIAYDIALPTASGDTVKLSSLKGKMVLLDFWASWCGPCRMSNWKLAKLYGKYAQKGFEIYSVSIDDNLKRWKRALKQDKMNWPAVIDKRGLNAPVLSDYKVYAIPKSYLLDRDGKVVAINLSPEELEPVLNEMLLL